MNNIKTEDLFVTSNKIINSLLKKHQYPWEILPEIKLFISSFSDTDFTEIKKGIFVGKNVSIADTATIIGPAIIGNDTVIRPGAYIRENVIIGNNCVVGNSTEIKNAIMLDHSVAPHFNYVGDSILGEYAHLGAGAICSNLKADGSNVVINNINTGLRKVGAFLGTHAEIGCNCVLNPGTIIGANTNVYPLTSLRGVYGSNLIIKSKDNIVIKQ